MRNIEIMELLRRKEGSGSQSKIAGLEAEIVAEIEKNNYHTRQQIADMIEEKFHIHISVATVGRLLKKNNIHRLKCGSLPAKANLEQQVKFYDEVLKPLMEKAKKSEVALLFLDASHFVMGGDFLGYIYGKTRRLVQTFSGRMRYNVLGAIDYATKRVLTVTNDTYITATEVCQMLEKISIAYAGKTVHIVLDNARYQKCSIVTDKAKQLGIILDYIPPYSPNLNLIERFWKFVKGELRSKYYDNFAEFQKNIDGIIETSDGKNKDKICRLISDKVQLFQDLKLVCNNTFSVPKNKSGNSPVAA